LDFQKIEKQRIGFVLFNKMEFEYINIEFILVSISMKDEQLSFVFGDEIYERCELMLKSMFDLNNCRHQVDLNTQKIERPEIKIFMHMHSRIDENEFLRLYNHFKIKSTDVFNGVKPLIKLDCVVEGNVRYNFCVNENIQYFQSFGLQIINPPMSFTICSENEFCYKKLRKIEKYLKKISPTSDCKTQRIQKSTCSKINFVFGDGTKQIDEHLINSIKKRIQSFLRERNIHDIEVEHI
jgi:hypothetical protein